MPQGRRLFPSLSVDEHLRMIRPAREVAGDGRNWTPAPSTSSSRGSPSASKNGGAQLSGGEQQMLAIGRALLTNPLLLIMDEPSEGLAPAIVENLIGVFRSLEEAGLAIILIEQNLVGRDDGRAAAARDGRRPDLHRDDGRGARRTIPRRSAASSASSR